MDVQTRLKEFLLSKRLNYKEFETKAGLSNASASRIGESSRESTFNRIANAFPDLNIEWLKTGEGEMLNRGVASPSLSAMPGSAPSVAELLAIIRSQQETIKSLSETVRQLAKGGE